MATIATTRYRCVGKVVIKISNCTLLEVKMFWTKLWGTKTGLICSRCANELV
jgi:hypothetical protein